MKNRNIILAMVGLVVSGFALLPKAQGTPGQQQSPQVYVRITSERQRDVLMKFLKNVDPSKYRLDFQEQTADGKMRKSTRGSLPLKEVRQIRGVSSLKGTTEMASIIETLKNFFSVAAVDKLKAALQRADSKPYEVKVVGQ